MPPRIYDAAHWESNAERALAVARGMRDPEARRIMENLAAGYRHWAEEATLEETKRRIAEGEKLVDRQEQSDAEFERGGNSKATGIVITVLSAMHGYLVVVQEHFRRLRRP